MLLQPYLNCNIQASHQTVPLLYLHPPWPRHSSWRDAYPSNPQKPQNLRGAPRARESRPHLKQAWDTQVQYGIHLSAQQPPISPGSSHCHRQRHFFFFQCHHQHRTLFFTLMGLFFNAEPLCTQDTIRASATKLT